jgi:hypothetical protein
MTIPPTSYVARSCSHVALSGQLQLTRASHQPLAFRRRRTGRVVAASASAKETEDELEEKSLIMVLPVKFC